MLCFCRKQKETNLNKLFLQKYSKTRRNPFCRKNLFLYRDWLKSVQILLSRTQPGPGRKVKQEQEEISRNIIPPFTFYILPALPGSCLARFDLHTFFADLCTGFSSQGRAKLRVFRGKTARKSTQPSPSLTRKPCTLWVRWIEHRK